MNLSKPFVVHTDARPDDLIAIALLIAWVNIPVKVFFPYGSLISLCQAFWMCYFCSSLLIFHHCLFVLKSRGFFLLISKKMETQGISTKL